eukprot:3452275-Ditylum_brightwellii.AAC.1
MTPTLVEEIKEVDFEYKEKSEDQRQANKHKAEELMQDLSIWVQENYPDIPDNKVYVPKFVLKSGEAAYKGLLQRQNAWLDNMSVVMIEGLAYDA